MIPRTDLVLFNIQANSANLRGRFSLPIQVTNFLLNWRKRDWPLVIGNLPADHPARASGNKSQLKAKIAAWMSSLPPQSRASTD
jgi:hypothetical protein